MGERLQKALESYVVPAPLRGQDFGHGPVPKRIAPIFRDRWDAEASVDLGATLQAALRASSALIVLCSPAAARSAWVGEEIRVFKRAGKQDRIYPVLIDGVPKRFDAEHNAHGAFPPALFERWDATGAGAPDEREPLAPDARPTGDDLRFTVLKLVAALTGLALTTLTQRQAEAERRERNTARWIAGAMSVLALGAAVGAVTSWRANVAARTRLENAVEMAARRVDDAAGFQDRYGVPSNVIHELLNGARKDFDELTQDAPSTPTLGLQRARLDRLFAQLYEAAGDSTQQTAMALRAFAHLDNVPTQRRVDTPATWFARLPLVRSVKTERALAQEVLGQARFSNGDLPGARLAFQSMASEADALVSSSADAASRMLAANARSHLARLSYESGDLESALRELDAAAKILAPHPVPVEVAADLAKVRSDEAEMLLELGRHAPALAQQQSAVATLNQITPPTPETRRALAVAVARQGDMRLAAQRDLVGARSDYMQARSMLADVLGTDGARTDIKRDLSLAHERAGDALLQAGEVDDAAKEFAACLKLRRELVAHDRSNSEWRRDLSVALERTGAVDSLQGRHGEASASLDEALRLREATLAEDPGSVVAARDLAILWMRLGQAQAAPTGAQLSAVDAAYAKAISLLTPLVEQAPAESRWRRDLAVAYAERGQARERAGKISDARSDWSAALDLVIKLRAHAPDDVQLVQDETWLKDRLKR